MTHLDVILGKLLLRNNCVVIPSFGGFVANNVSAKVDVKNGLITPPSKALSFNKNLSNNDGLIINHLSREQNISFDTAQEIISKEVQQIKINLEAGKRVHFNNVGFLYTNSAGKIAFEQDRFFNLLLSSYGMGNVQFISEEAETKEERTVKEERKVAPVFEVIPGEITTEESAEAQENDDTIVHPAAEKTSRSLLSKVVKYAAVAAIIPMAFYSFWIPMKTDVLKSGIIYKTDFNPFQHTLSAKYQPESSKESLVIDSVQELNTLTEITENLNSDTPVFTYPLDDDMFIPVWRKNLEKTTSKEVEKTEVPHNSYHAIVGCFGNPNNAEDLIQDLNAKGFNAYKVDVKGGLHRVSAGHTPKRANISTLRKEIAPTGLPVWILKK